MWPKVITFDCYGTLVRWPETLRAFFATLVKGEAERVKFYNDFAAAHVRLKKQTYRPYSQILGDALAETMNKHWIGDVAIAQRALLGTIRNIPPYDEVPERLQALASKYSLAIISNTEDDLIAETVVGLLAPFTIITAEQARRTSPIIGCSNLRSTSLASASMKSCM